MFSRVLGGYVRQSMFEQHWQTSESESPSGTWWHDDEQNHPANDIQKKAVGDIVGGMLVLLQSTLLIRKCYSQPTGFHVL